MKKLILSLAISSAIASVAYADKPVINGPFSFPPLTASGAPGSEPACAPFKLPEGFEQIILIQEDSEACNDDGILNLDVVADENDWNDMNTVNETGAHAGRFLYRTHENGFPRSAVSAIDLYSGESATYVASDFGIDPAFSRLDGIEWTPWGTILFAEESGANGRLFECKVDGLLLDCADRPAVGRMSHEGIAAAGDGTVYIGDELNGGSIYKFVPNHYGDLSAGTLYALNIPGAETVCSGTTGVGATPLGVAEWVELTILPGQSAREAADLAGVSDFCRPEDAEIIGPNLYFATTTTKNVLQIPINSDTPLVTEFFGINTNVPNESDDPSYGLNSPDNLSSDAAGNLVIVEDNSSKSDIWFAGKDLDGDGTADSVALFATLTTIGAEASGIYFAPSMPDTMLVNIQHAGDGNDMTLAIQKKVNGKGKAKGQKK